jgi:hypothetical protein
MRLFQPDGAIGYAGLMRRCLLTIFVAAFIVVIHPTVTDDLNVVLRPKAEQIALWHPDCWQAGVSRRNIGIAEQPCNVREQSNRCIIPAAGPFGWAASVFCRAEDVPRAP